MRLKFLATMSATPEAEESGIAYLQASLIKHSKQRRRLKPLPPLNL